MNSTYGTLPALNGHILLPCCCVSPASCRFVCKLSKHPVFNHICRLHPRVPVTAGSAGLCANTTMLGLAAQPWPARHAMPTDVPTHRHTARPLVFGQEPARFHLPAPQPALDYACSQRTGEKQNKLRPQITPTSFHLIVRMAP